MFDWIGCGGYCIGPTSIGGEIIGGTGRIKGRISIACYAMEVQWEGGGGGPFSCRLQVRLRMLRVRGEASCP